MGVSYQVICTKKFLIREIYMGFGCEKLSGYQGVEMITIKGIGMKKNFLDALDTNVLPNQK